MAQKVHIWTLNWRIGCDPWGIQLCVGRTPCQRPKLPDPKDRVQVYETVTEAIDDSQHGSFRESIEKLKSTLTTEQNSVPIHYLLGLNYYRTKEFANSVAEFKKALEISPNYMLAIFNLGLANAALATI